MASGDLMVALTARHGTGLSSNGATPDAISAATGIRPVWDFDDTTDETMTFEGVLPPNYDGGGLTCRFYGSMDGDNTGTKSISVDAAIERLETGVDLGSGGNDFAAVNNSGAVTVDNSADNEFNFTITFSNGSDMDSLAAGEPFRLKVTRDANGTTATDDASGDWQLHRIKITET